MIKEPLISVIIPVHNDPEGLNDTITSIVNQKFNQDSYEIIVVDNDSKDKTLTIANEFKERCPNLIKVFIEDKIQSSYAARNKGINSSTGEIIVFIDADMTVELEWLFKIKQLMSEKDIKYAGCNVEIVQKNKSFAGLYNKITGFKVGGRIKFKHYAPTCCLVIKREIIDKIGLFDYRLISGGDMEFGNRAWCAGYEQVFAENIKMSHPARDTMKKLLKKYFRLGRGKFQLSYYYPDIYPYDKNIFRKILCKSTISFAKNMRYKLKKYNFYWLYIILFYFIDWFKRLTTLIGYYYERKQLGHS